MAFALILEGVIMGLILMAVCAVGIKDGAVGMLQLYHPEVQEHCVQLGLTTHEKIKKRALMFRVVALPIYISYVLICVYAVNGARGFREGFLQLYIILLILNLIDRFVIDWLWVEKTSAWIIPGTEDLMPYITTKDKVVKWTFGILGSAVIAAALAAVMGLIVK